MQTTTNYLILSQACADLEMTLILSFNVFHQSYLGGEWFGGRFGEITCRTYLGVVSISPCFSVWILALIAIDRFYAVTLPLQLSPISRHLKKIILLLWLWCFASTINVLVNGSFTKVKQSFYCGLASILNEWIAFHIIDNSLNIVFPFLIIIVLYITVCLRLWSRKVPGEGANQNERQAEAIQTAKKVTRMMIAVVVLLVMCWFPFFIIVTLQTLQPGSVEISARLILFIGLLAISFSGLNPYIYLTFSHKFRIRCKKLIGNFVRKSRISIFFITSRTQSFELHH